MNNTKTSVTNNGKVTELSQYSTNKKVRGFTIFELLLVLGISAAIAIQLLPEAALEADQLLVDSVVLDAQLYLDAVYARCTDLIVDDANNVTKCWGDDENHYTISNLEADNYLARGSVENPFSGATNVDDFHPSLVNHTLANSTVLPGVGLLVDFDVIGAGVANNVAARLPGGTSTLKSGDIYTISMQLPVPANESSHEVLLPVDGSRAMTGNLDAGNNSLLNVTEIRSVGHTNASCTLTSSSSSSSCDNIRISGALIGPTDGINEWPLQLIGDLQVSEDITANAFYYDSDARLKENLQQITSAQMELLLQLATVSYNRIDADQQKFGFIAQDVQEKFPGLVVADQQGMLAVDYQAIIPLLLSVVSYQQQQLDELIEQTK